MRPKILQFIPTFLRNFNIEQRVYSKLDEIDHSNRPAPWHQSTAQLFEMIKEASSKIDERNQNGLVEKRSRSMKICSNGPALHPEVTDKRPKKENELINCFDHHSDHDFLTYGYHSAKKVQLGHLALRQVDEFLKEVYSNDKINDKNKIENFCQKNKIKLEEMTTLLEYLKPLYKLEPKSNA